MAIVVGCLLGVFLPVLVKYSDAVASGSNVWKYYLAMLAIVLVFTSVIIVGIPVDKVANDPWTLWVSFGMVVCVLCFLLFVVLLRPLSINERNLRAQHWSVLRTPNDYRQHGLKEIDAKHERRMASKDERRRLMRARLDDAKAMAKAKARVAQGKFTEEGRRLLKNQPRYSQ